MISLVIFDIGHVLVHVADDWFQAADFAGVRLPFTNITAEQKQAVKAEIVKNEVGQQDQAAFAEHVGRILGLPAEHVTRISCGFLRQMYDGIDELLDQVAAFPGVQTGVLSNTNALHWEKMLDPFDISCIGHERFDFCWPSQEVGDRKPNPGIYEHVEKTSAILPGNILFFDNLIENLETAQARGWQTELIQMDSNPEPQLHRYLKAYGVLP